MSIMQLTNDRTVWLESQTDSPGAPIRFRVALNDGSWQYSNWLGTLEMSIVYLMLQRAYHEKTGHVLLFREAATFREKNFKAVEGVLLDQLERASLEVVDSIELGMGDPRDALDAFKAALSALRMLNDDQ